jgi:gamma-glutamyltranspeptidase/glutathione hydrolase
MTRADLAAHRGEWVETISQEYHGLHVHELPPNGQGLAALIALGILRHRDVRQFPVDSADSAHLQIEAVKIAFAVARRHVADPAYMKSSVAEMLDEKYLSARASEIRMESASTPPFRMPTDHGTVYLTTADADGMMVSFIQSNYMGFGSGVVIPDTGISMQNRGAGFSLERGHPNEVGGGKRPYHTIIPAFVMRGGKPLMSFGVMGGHFQPQGHVQMVARIFDYGQNPQAASDAPRWQVTENCRVTFEPEFPRGVIEQLRRRGHKIVEKDSMHFGGAQIILCGNEGYCAASDHRKDGCAVGF